jgi:hypothetical protein
MAPPMRERVTAPGMSTSRSATAASTRMAHMPKNERILPSPMPGAKASSQASAAGMSANPNPTSRCTAVLVTASTPATPSTV